jgi:hypothetical protein
MDHGILSNRARLVRRVSETIILKFWTAICCVNVWSLSASATACCFSASKFEPRLLRPKKTRQTRRLAAHRRATLHRTVFPGKTAEWVANIGKLSGETLPSEHARQFFRRDISR